VGSQRHIPATLPPPRKETQYPSYWRLGGTQVRSGWVRKISPPPEFDPWTVNHEGTVKDFRRTRTVRDAVFNVASVWNSLNAKTQRQAWRKLWPAVMIAEGALDEHGFVGFNVHNRHSVHEKLLMFKKLDPSNPECEVSQVDVEECISAAKRYCSVTP